MLDAIFDLFDRDRDGDRRHTDERRGGLRGLLDMLSDDDDDERDHH
jgi:hypothetical protein